jgi:bifunctional non-homologous end joining protein LigD
MLAIASTGASGRPATCIEDLVGTHEFDLKSDGIRCWAEAGELYNRHGVKISHKYPEIVSALAESAPYERLDGELVARDGSFETALTRDKQEKPRAISAMVKSHPMQYVVFDVPSDRLMPTPWWRRREALLAWQAHGIDPRVSISPTSRDADFVTRVAALGMEGVIAKRLVSRYQPGKRSMEWVKFKNTHRISCLVRGYRPGSGHRAHFGNMQLALIDERLDPPFVDIGTVGSGFTERETHMLKARLDAGDVLVVEIECLNVTSGNQLRFPVYKGIRTDVQVTDCTIAQLATLTRC